MLKYTKLHNFLNYFPLKNALKNLNFQTEESKNMSMDSVKNVVDAAALSAPAPAPLSQSDRLNHVDEVEGTTPSNVMITVSSAAAALEKKEEVSLRSFRREQFLVRKNGQKIEISGRFFSLKTEILRKF